MSLIYIYIWHVCEERERGKEMFIYEYVWNISKSILKKNPKKTQKQTRYMNKTNKWLSKINAPPHKKKNAPPSPKKKDD